MSRLTRDGTSEPFSRDQILRREQGQGNIHFPCSADHEQDWQPYLVDPSIELLLLHVMAINICISYIGLQSEEIINRSIPQPCASNTILCVLLTVQL